MKITNRSHIAVSILLFFVSMYMPLYAQNSQSLQGPAGLPSAFFGQYKGTLHIVPRINPMDDQITEYDTTEIPAVESFPIQSYQYASLVKQASAAPSQGRIEPLHYFPSALITARNVDVWLPSDYDPNKKYGVIYMHDGQNLFDGNSTWNHQEWGIDESVSAHNAIAQFNQQNQADSSKSIHFTQTEYIVVGIWNDGVNRHSMIEPLKNSLPANWKTQIDQGLGHQESTWQKQFQDNVDFILSPASKTHKN